MSKNEQRMTAEQFERKMRTLYSRTKMTLHDNTGDTIFRALYAALALNGEAGEVAEKVKRVARGDYGTLVDCILDDEFNKRLQLELGDVMYCVCMLCDEFGYSLERVMELCIEKFESRAKRGTLMGEGDDR